MNDDDLDDRLQAHLVEVLDGVESISNRTIDRVTRIVTDVLDGRRADRELITQVLAETKHLIGLAERLLLAHLERSHASSDPAQARVGADRGGPSKDRDGSADGGPPPLPLGRVG